MWVCRPAVRAWTFGLGATLVLLSPAPATAQDAAWRIVSAPDALPVRAQSEKAAHEIAVVLRVLAPLPRPITVRLERCGEAAEAVWLPDRDEILLCDEIAELVAAGAVDTVAALRYVLAHEIGHATADLFAVPVSGSGEEEADELGVLLLLEADEALRAGTVEAERALERLASMPDLLDATRRERLARADAVRCLRRGAAHDAAEACRRQYIATLAAWRKAGVVR